MVVQKQPENNPPPPQNDEARLAWDAVKDQTSPATFDMVATRYPNTLYGDLARARAAELRAAVKQTAPPKQKVALNTEPEEVEPAPPKTKPKKSPATRSSSFSWGVIIGSFPKSQASKARGRLKAARANGLDAVLIDTDDYGKLAPGLFAVVVGAGSRADALSLAPEVQQYFGDAYAKQLQ